MMGMEFEALLDGNLSDKYHYIKFVNDYEDGEWRYEKLQNFIGDSLLLTALSEKERSALIADLKIETIRTESIKKLRTGLLKNKAEGSELGEICLYGIMRSHYNALPIVPKIFYKQNSNDYAKGADSVHLILTDSDFEIWLGESKFYNDLDKAFSAALDSILEMLDTDKLKKESSIITNLSELSYFRNEKLTKNMIESINKILSFNSSIDELKKRLHIPIFLMYECSLTKKSTDLNMCRSELKKVSFDKIEKYKLQLEKKLEVIYNFHEICFHVILFPIPEKEPIRQWFIEDFSKGK